MQNLELLLDRRRNHRRTLEPVAQGLVIESDRLRRFLCRHGVDGVPVVDEIAFSRQRFCLLLLAFELSADELFQSVLIERTLRILTDELMRPLDGGGWSIRSPQTAPPRRIRDRRPMRAWRAAPIPARRPPRGHLGSIPIVTHALVGDELHRVLRRVKMVSAHGGKPHDEDIDRLAVELFENTLHHPGAVATLGSRRRQQSDQTRLCRPPRRNLLAAEHASRRDARRRAPRASGLAVIPIMRIESIRYTFEKADAFDGNRKGRRLDCGEPRKGRRLDFGSYSGLEFTGRETTYYPRPAGEVVQARCARLQPRERPADRAGEAPEMRPGRRATARRGRCRFAARSRRAVRSPERSRTGPTRSPPAGACRAGRRRCDRCAR